MTITTATWLSTYASLSVPLTWYVLHNLQFEELSIFTSHHLLCSQKLMLSIAVANENHNCHLLVIFSMKNGLSTVLLQYLCVISGIKQNKHATYFLFILKLGDGLENFHI